MNRRAVPAIVLIALVLIAAGWAVAGRNGSRPAASPTAVSTRISLAPPAPSPTLPAPAATSTAPAPTAQPTKPAAAKLVVSSRPVKGTILVDGKGMGAAPRTLAVPPGAHTIVLRAAGYQDGSRKVAAQPGQVLKLDFTLQPVPASVVVATGNPKAVVEVDGKRAGAGTVKLQLAPGKHMLTARLPGYFPWSRQLELRPGAVVKLQAKFQPKPARLDVSTTPTGAQIYVDGKARGLTPKVVNGIPAGKHTVKLARSGYEVFSAQLAFGPDATVRLRRPLLAVAGTSASVPHRPLAIMVENHPDARPQSGLAYADVVLEAPAEFGISRFIAVFITREPKVVGPVRSARKYFVLWAKEFNPLYFHAGGSPGSFSLADRIHLTRTNALWDGRGFYRTSDRVAPHNLYTSIPTLMQVERRKGHSLRGGTWGGLRFKEPGTRLGPLVASSIRLNFNDWYYVDWRWDPSTGRYRRWMQGAAAIERTTGSQITATTVIVRQHAVSRIQGDDKGREEIQVFGSGKAWVFQDGRMTPATWSRDDVNSPTVYRDSAGRQIPVNKGNVWLEVIPQYGSMRYSK